MDNANEELSKHVHKVLDVIGASKYTRKKYWELAMLLEIINTVETLIYSKPSKKRSLYQVGSRCEGTTTPDLDSDFDLIHCDDGIPVVENLFESKQRGTSYLMLTDEDTKPGYVRLQFVKDKCPRLVGMCDKSEDSIFIDRKGRVCLNNSVIFVGGKTSRNGPAHTIPGEFGNCQHDAVYALRCRQIPRSSNSWLHRIRKYGWPSKKQLQAMESYGCFFVGVGHPHSNNEYGEWRISFSLQERDLMSCMNETQHKCYIILKMIKKDIIERKAGESISSYHCKTSLFYTIENSHRHFWTNDKLILCVQQCLKRLFIWVKAKNCPNYFIPEENMFDKLSVMTLKKIEYVLNNILESGIKFLYELTCDNFCELLNSKWCGDELVHVCSLANSSTRLQPRYLVCYNITVRIYGFRNSCLQLMYMSSNTLTCYLNGMMQLLLYLQHTNHVTDHTTRDVRMALDSIIPHIKLQCEQCMFVQYMSQGNQSDLRSMTIPNVISDIGECDLISSELSKSSVYIQFEEYQEECERILVSCENKIEPYVISVCSCYLKKCTLNTSLAKKLRLTEMSSKEFRQLCTTGCMVFHPFQKSIVHEALQYEIFRSVYTRPEYEMNRNYWLNWITVDSKVYLYFLQYLLYLKKKKRTETETALHKLDHALRTDRNLGHRETGWNLVGWICLQGKELQAAWRLFHYSWTIRPFKNAAKWHMLILLREIIKGE